VKPSEIAERLAREWYQELPFVYTEDGINALAQRIQAALEEEHKRGFIEGWYSNYEAPCSCGHLGSQHIKYHGCAAENCTCKEFDCPADPPDFDAVKDAQRAAIEEEREACAKLCEEIEDLPFYEINRRLGWPEHEVRGEGETCAAAIRARGEKEKP
jgi:hypothetical protein